MPKEGAESVHPNHVRRLMFAALYTTFVFIVVTSFLAGCGDTESVGVSSQEREEAMKKSLQGFENRLEFELTEPLYSMLTAEVLKVEEAQPYKLVLVEVKASEYPAGLESNPYIEQSINPGTLLVVEWNSETPVETGSVFMIPAEFLNAVNGIRITIKGTPREAKGAGQE